MIRRFDLWVLLALVCFAGNAHAAATSAKSSKFYFNVQRPDSSYVTSANGHIRVCPADDDTTGECESAVYVGGVRMQWYVTVDSTDVYQFLETTGTDSLIAGMDRVPIWGPGLKLSEGSIAQTRSFGGAVTFGLGAGSTDSLRWQTAMRAEQPVIFQNKTYLGNAPADSVIVEGWQRNQGRLTVQDRTTLGNAGLDSVAVVGRTRFSDRVILGNAPVDSVTVKGRMRVAENMAVQGTSQLGNAAADSVTLHAAIVRAVRSLKIQGELFAGNDTSDVHEFDGYADWDDMCREITVLSGTNGIDAPWAGARPGWTCDRIVCIDEDETNRVATVYVYTNDEIYIGLSGLVSANTTFMVCMSRPQGGSDGH